MRVPSLLDDLARRLRQGSTWVGILGYGTFFTLFPVLFAGWKALSPGGALVAYWLSACYGLLSPLPWLWTGDDRMAPGPLRGLAQSLPFAGLLVALSWGLGLMALPGALVLAPYLPLHVLGICLVGYFIALGIRQEARSQESAAQARQAQFQLLQGQLSPHFLFNALSAFAELGRRDWPATEQGLLDLAQVYRGLLDLGQRSEAPLGEERELLEAMLAVEALRFGPRLEVHWDWEPGLEHMLMPPLLLLPLVENALKHGVGPHAGPARLEISVRREGRGLHLEVANTGAWGAQVIGTGTGLKNLEARLRLAYGAEASFALERQGDWTRATLRLPDPGLAAP